MRKIEKILICLLFIVASASVQGNPSTDAYEDFKAFQTETQQKFTAMKKGEFTAWDTLDDIIERATQHQRVFRDFSVWEAGYAARHTLPETRQTTARYNDLIRQLYAQSQTLFDVFIQLFTKIKDDTSDQHQETTAYLMHDTQDTECQQQLAAVRQKLDQEHQLFFGIQAQIKGMFPEGELGKNAILTLTKRQKCVTCARGCLGITWRGLCVTGRGLKVVGLAVWNNFPTIRIVDQRHHMD